MIEPNIFGAVMAAMMIVHFAYFRFCLRHFVLHGMGLLALLLTASRFPYLAYALCMPYYLFRSGLIRRPIVQAGLAAGVISITILTGFFFEKLYNTYDAYVNRQDTITSRNTILAAAWRGAFKKPIIGHGPLDFGLTNYDLLNILGATEDKALWIWQMFVAIIYDEGLIGLGFYLAFLIALWAYTEQMIKEGQKHFLAYQAGALALVISSQGTTEHLTATFGVILGLANSPPFVRRAASVVRTVRRRPGNMVAGPQQRMGTVQAGRSIVPNR